MDDTDPPVLGTFCSLPICHTVDFLPLTCPYCHLTFCTSHALPASLHTCPNDPTLLRVQGNRFDQKFDEFLPDPNRRGTEREDATREADRRKEAARAILEKNFGPPKPTPVGGGGAGSTKAAGVKPVNPLIALMKLKQRAKQGDPRMGAGDVPMEQRVYCVAVLFDYVEGERVEKGVRELWFPKVTTTGKALDLLATHFKLENVNNVSKDPNKLLRLATTAGTPIPTGKKLDECGVENGGTVWVLRGAPVVVETDAP